MERVDQYFKLVSDYVKIPVEVIKSKTRKRPVCEARQICSTIIMKHTPLTLWAIAALINYKSHASVRRDKIQVEILMKNDKEFSWKYKQLLRDAEELANKFRREDLMPNPGTLIAGDICWFWNKGMRFPILETLKSFHIDYQNRIWFRTNDEKKPDFTSCKFAGSRVLPLDFDLPVTDLLKESTEETDGFFEESLIAPVIKEDTVTKLPELCTT